MWGRGEFDPDRVAFGDFAAGEHDPHDPGLADEVAQGVARQGGGHEAGLEFVELAAGVAQPGHLDQRPSETQTRAGREAEQIDAARRDILAHDAGCQTKPGGFELVVQFGVDQVDLAQIGHGRVLGDARAVLDRHPHMRVALDPEPSQEADAALIRLRQPLAV